MPAGDYRFVVEARNFYGRSSGEAGFAFSIASPWYFSWWALFLYALGAGWLVLGLIKLRVYQLELQQERLEDIIEEIVGEIQDEYDDDEDVARISEVTPGQYNVDGAMLVDDLETTLDTTLRDGTSSDTIGGLAVELAGRLPMVGDVVQVGDYDLTIKEVDGRRVSLLQLSPRTVDEEQGATG